MRSLNRIGILLALVGLVFGPATAFADVDRNQSPKKQANPEATTAAKNAAVAACEPGISSVDLDVNNVRARIYNNGDLFYPDAVYEVPKGSGLHSIFASSIWIGGLANGELRMAAATYAQFGEDFEFFPGPLNDDGTVPNPNDCSQYDTIYKVSRADIVQYNLDGTATGDMLNWPYELGAPVVDGDGNPNNYDLAAGDRPEVLGDQTVWFIMNDAAGPHLTTNTAPIGLEAQVTAFAFATGDALNNMTFYKYRFAYKPVDNVPLENVWLGIWSDPDLGNPNDDFVGADTTLGLGFVYNGDPLDEGSEGYGNSPPAAGYDFFQGPLVNNDGLDNDHDGEVDESDERLRMTRFVYYNNDWTDTGGPEDAEDFYGYLRGRWKDGSPLTVGGDGFGGSVPTNFMFPGDPPSFWSEDNTDGTGARNIPADRRLLMSTGPFTLQPGDVQEIVFGIVWSQTRDRIGSVKKLKQDDILAQGAFDFNFDLPRAPDAPLVSIAEMDEQIVLSWNNPETSNNYLNQYNAPSPFLVDPNVSDTTFTFEGYKIYQYESLDQAPEDGQVIATLDVQNGVTTIVDNAIDVNTGAPIRSVVATGTDSGVQNYLVLERDFITDTPLRNGTEYHYGVQAYAYNQFSDPSIRQSRIERVSVIPTQIMNTRGGTTANVAPDNELIGQIGKISDANILARIADPLAVSGAEYRFRFYRIMDADSHMVLTYDVLRDGEVLLSGEEYYNERGVMLPFGEDVYFNEGLSFTIEDAPADFAGHGDGIVETAYPGVDPCAGGAGGCATYGGNTVWHSLNANADYYVAAGGGAGGIDRLSRWIEYASPRDFELRFTDAGGWGVHAFEDDMCATVPFELWDIGISTPDDPSDDVRMIPFVLSGDGETGPEWGWATDTDPYFGYPISDWIYWMDAESADGYENFAANCEQVGAGGTYPFETDGSAQGYWADFHGGFVYPIGRSAIADFAGDGTPPPSGTVIRFITTKPIAQGDEFVFDTESIAPQFNQAEVVEENLDIIGIVPNPYKGASEYDVVGSFRDEARFINMPEQATVRIFSLDGTLVRTLQKNSPDTILRWNLQTEDGLPIASGMYIIHIDVPDVGERVLKFGVILDKIHLDVF